MTKPKEKIFKVLVEIEVVDLIEDIASDRVREVLDSVSNDEVFCDVIRRYDIKEVKAK